MEYAAYAEGLEAIRHSSKQGTEYWMARELMPLLKYASWDNFKSVIEKAKLAADAAGAPVSHHFHEATNMVSIGSGAKREVDDIFLSRYACYLIAMNANSSKTEVGHAMTYFAIQTRRQEVHDKKISEAERLRLRLRVMENNQKLAGAAKAAGVVHYPFFQDAGYQGLYGMSLGNLKARRGLGTKDDLLDHAGELELSANDFRTKLTEHRLNRNNIRNEADAIHTHRQVGSEVRSVIVKENGVKPEDLPVEKSIKPLVQKHKRELKKKLSGAPGPIKEG